MFKITRLVSGAQTWVSIVNLITDLAGKANDNKALRAGLSELAATIKTWKPASPIERIDRKLDAIDEYARDYAEQFPDADEPEVWGRRVKHLRSRTRLASSLNGKQRRKLLNEVRTSTDALLTDALQITSDRLADPDQLEGAEPDQIESAEHQTESS